MFDVQYFAASPAPKKANHLTLMPLNVQRKFDTRCNENGSIVQITRICGKDGNGAKFKSKKQK
eukprot:11158628-Ditylum_brightwellii.AAC.1